MLQSFILHHRILPALPVLPSIVRCGYPISIGRNARWNSGLAQAMLNGSEEPPLSLETQSPASTSPPPRLNAVNIQQVSKHVYNQLFPEYQNTPKPPGPSQELIDLSVEHLKQHELFGKNSDNSPPISFDLPELVGKDLGEHFYKLGMNISEPYRSRAIDFAEFESLPEQPLKWKVIQGWTMYVPGKTPKRVDHPLEDQLVFDVEVMYKLSPFAVMACAASKTAWYAWISPWLLGKSQDPCHLVPLGPPDKERIVIGHNVGYDRARVREEYSVEPTKNFYLDTMSLHVAVNGMCSQQRPTWMKYMKNMELRAKMAMEMDSESLQRVLQEVNFGDEEEELWIAKSSINSLKDVAKFHCGIELDKQIRDFFGEEDMEVIQEHLQELLGYCATDVAATHAVYRKVLPGFLQVCPHPVSFAALRHLSSVILPVTKAWEDYIQNAEKKYIELSGNVERTLLSLAKGAIGRFLADPKNVVDNFEPDPISFPEAESDQRKKKSNAKAKTMSKSKLKVQTKGKGKVGLKPLTREDTATNPWFSQFDWTVEPVRMVKPKKGEEPRRCANQKMPGYPFWFRDLRKKAVEDIKVTVRTRVAPLLLQLRWEGYPLFWSTEYGWTFRVPNEEVDKYKDKPLVRCEFNPEIKEDVKLQQDKDHVYFKLPHREGPKARCTNPLSKNYLKYFEDGVLTSEYEEAKTALQMNAACSYWIGARDRIMSQMVVYENQVKGGFGFLNKRTKSKMAKVSPELGFIIPQLIPMGTITRRAVERTWLTASNAKKNRVGSELKAMIMAPPGYSFVGADVDSQELWIASLVGDAQFGLHGGNAIGFMTLEGTKAAGTDLHSKTARILGISRNDAKIFNYGRIYGAGLKFAATLLRQFSSGISDEDAAKTAEKLYKETKGNKIKSKVLYEDGAFWYGGTESFVFNRLEQFADQDRPRTPVLGAGLTEALMREYLSKGGFMTSRINWAIQSSGVDYLHLLIVSMDYLILRYNINARLAITVHDEIRYLVKEEHQYKAAMALQIANVWTRAMFAKQMGINDLPQSCAYFSAVDIDKVLRKEVDMDCKTPSHETPIPPGISLDITQLLAKGEESRLDPSEEPKTPFSFENIPPYNPRPTVMEELQQKSDIYFLRAQMARSEAEVSAIAREKSAAIREILHKPGRVIGKSEEETAHTWHLLLNERISQQPIGGSSFSAKKASKKKQPSLLSDTDRQFILETKIMPVTAEPYALRAVKKG